MKDDGESKMVKSSGVALDGEFWVSKVLKTIEQLEGDAKHLSLLVDVDEHLQELYMKAKSITKKLHKVRRTSFARCVINCGHRYQIKRPQKELHFSFSLWRLDCVALRIQRAQMYRHLRSIITLLLLFLKHD